MTLAEDVDTWRGTLRHTGDEAAAAIEAIVASTARAGDQALLDLDVLRENVRRTGADLDRAIEATTREIAAAEAALKRVAASRAELQRIEKLVGLPSPATWSEQVAADDDDEPGAVDAETMARTLAPHKATGAGAARAAALRVVAENTSKPEPDKSGTGE